MKKMGISLLAQAFFVSAPLAAAQGLVAPGAENQQEDKTLMEGHGGEQDYLTLSPDAMLSCLNKAIEEGNTPILEEGYIAHDGDLTCKVILEGTNHDIGSIIPAFYALHFTSRPVVGGEEGYNSLYIVSDVCAEGGINTNADIAFMAGTEENSQIYVRKAGNAATIITDQEKYEKYGGMEFLFRTSANILDGQSSLDLDTEIRLESFVTDALEIVANRKEMQDLEERVAPRSTLYYNNTCYHY